jgi:hypothetical protein
MNNCFRDDIGLGARFFNSIQASIKSVNESTPSIRKLVTLLGMDNAVSHDAFKKNLADITVFDPTAKSSGGIRAGVIVKVNRSGVDEYFITRREVDPSKHHPSVYGRDQNNRNVPNPWWARIDKNQTIDPKTGALRKFVAEEVDGAMVYREARPTDEDQVFLNIQKPYDGEYAEPNVVYADGIDAYRFTKNGVEYYEPISKHQVVSPDGYDNRGVRMDSLDDVTEKELTGTRADVARLDTERSSWLRGHGIAGPMLGAFVGQMADSYFNEDDQVGLEFVGLALGSRRVRGRLKAGYLKYAPNRYGNRVPNELASVADEDLKRRRYFEAATATKTFTDDPVEAAEHLGWWNSVKQSIKEGGDGASQIFRSRYSESGFTFLRRFGDNAIVKRIQDALVGLQPAVARYRGMAPSFFNGRIANMDREMIAEYGLDGSASSFRKYETQGMGLSAKKVLGEGYSDEEYLKLANSSANRIMTTGAKIDSNGKYVYGDMPNVKAIYEDEAMGKEIMRQDEMLLRDPIFKEYVEANRQFFRATGIDYVNQMERRIARDIAEMGFTDIEQSALNRFAGQTQPMEKYKRYLKDQYTGAGTDDSRVQLKAEYDALEGITKRDKARRGAVKDDAVRRIMENHAGKTRVIELDYRYLPQMPSASKINQLRDRFYRENNLLDASKDDRSKMFEEHLMDMLLEVNVDPKAKRAILEFDPSTGKFDRKVFKNAEDARAAVRNAAASLPEGDRILDRLDDFVISETKPATKSRGPKEQFYVSTPGDFGSNPFRSANRARYGGLSEYVAEGAFMARSNWLDNPRTRVLPMEILEDDMTVIRSRYAFDAGRKIHNMQYDMMDQYEWQKYHVMPLKEAFVAKYSDSPAMLKKLNAMTNRLNSIYETTNLTHNMSGAQLDSYVKNLKRTDTIRNMYFLRFGWGFGFYNMFEFMAIGPLLSSFSNTSGSLKFFAKNKQALDNYTEILQDLGIGKKSIRGTNFEYDDPEIISNSFSDKAAAMTSDLSDKMAGFSLSKTVLKKFFKVDMEEQGLMRLAFDSFDGSNLVGTTVVAHASLMEANKLARVLRAMPENGVLREGADTYTRGDVIRKLGTLGIGRDQVDDFVEQQIKFQEVINAFDTNQLGKVDLSATHRGGYEYTTQILRNAAETMHGTSRVMRPEAWLTPGGKLLSMYSTYPFNFATQFVQRRIRQPLEDWFAKHATQGALVSTIDGSMFQILNAYKKGDMLALNRMGFSKEAVEEFPLEAVQQVTRLLGSMGVGIAGLTGLAVIKDMLSYPINEMAEQDQWVASRRMVTINPYAPQDEQYTWGDLDTDMGAKEFMDVMWYMLGLSARTGAAGRYGDIATNPWIIKRDGVMGLTPVTGDINRLFQDMAGLFDGEPADWPLDAGKMIGKKVFEFAPFINTSILSPTRKAGLQFLEDEYGFFAEDTETGERLFAEDFKFN